MLITNEIKFFVDNSLDLCILFTDTLHLYLCIKNGFCMDPENVPGASGVFKKDNMKLTVYFKL